MGLGSRIKGRARQGKGKDGLCRCSGKGERPLGGSSGTGGFRSGRMCLCVYSCVCVSLVGAVGADFGGWAGGGGGGLLWAGLSMLAYFCWALLLLYGRLHIDD